MSDLLRGELVRFTAESPDTTAAKLFRWNQDSEWFRFLDTEPPRQISAKKVKENEEKALEKEDIIHNLFFNIRTLEDNSLIGFIGLFDLRMNHADSLVAIALGERDYWGKGYGTDAMRIMLRYAFYELNLRRVGLIVFEYNPRAIRSYEKVGFIPEGSVRRVMQRDGKRWDFKYMGILREEWLARQTGEVDDQ